jgi:hypothetical protein
MTLRKNGPVFGGHIMTITVTLDPDYGPSEWVDWFQNFYVLAVRRTEPLWPIVGLPSSIIRTADPVRRMALDALAQRADAFLPESLGGNLPRWLTSFFQQVEAAYGGGTAQELLDWMQRSVSDQRVAWWAWNFLLPELAGQRGADRPRIAPPWATAKVERFQATVEEEFNDGVRNQQHILETAAEGIELSAAESDLLTVNGPVDGPLDVLGMADSAASVHRTYRVFRNLDAWFTVTDWDQLLNWARENGPIAIIPMPAAKISLPKPFDTHLGH